MHTNKLSADLSVTTQGVPIIQPILPILPTHHVSIVPMCFNKPFKVN